MLEDGRELVGEQVRPVLEVRRVFQARECALELAGAEERQMPAVLEVARARHGALERVGAVWQAHCVPAVVRWHARQRVGGDAR